MDMTEIKNQDIRTLKCLVEKTTRGVVKEVGTPGSGILRVYIQGNFEERQGKTLFLTCHDIGANHRSFYPFLQHHSMQEVRNRSVFLHVCLPGQDDNEPNLPDNFVFPTLDQIGQDLVCVLDELGVKTVIGLGEGAGANIMCRFALRMIQWKLGSNMNQAAWEYLIDHRFGPGLDDKQSYIKLLQERLNSVNLSKYMASFLHRTDLSAELADKLKVDALLVVGSRASMSQTVYSMHQAMSKVNTTLLVVDDVADVFAEAPLKVSRALILFCKGCGVLSGVSIPGMERQRTLSSSMEEADTPRKLSLTRPPPSHMEKV
uniref:N-myc downstream regulated n=1 Tax=Romanomermis culicivorax TaxID=13658 RepID=A0A915JAZ5_ROMCU